ncbi:MAG: hypothetical protein ACOY93_22630, partial [Bacillota bacterium]
GGMGMLRTVAVGLGAYLLTAALFWLLMLTVGGPFVYIGFIGLFGAGLVPAWMIMERALQKV